MAQCELTGLMHAARILYAVYNNVCHMHDYILKGFFLAVNDLILYMML